MIAGVMRLAPSQETPAYGSENVSAPIAARYEPDSTSSKANVPSASVCVVSVDPPASLRSSTVMPGSPSSPSSSCPDVPPPGLKSRQTTPVIPPESASGTTA